MPPDDLAPNLFNALFEFRPRDNHTPKENFPSEAFAYVLKTCNEARDAWLSRVLGQPVKTIRFDVTTRQTERDDENVAIYPDMRIKAVLNHGEPFDLYSEHKWGSKCEPKQIKKYLMVAQQHGDHCCLAFVGSSFQQKKEAECSDARMKGKAFLWEDVFQTLEALSNKPEMLVQFLEFMKTHGLSPGKPISPRQMQAYLESFDFLARLTHYAAKLLNDYSWEQIPERYRKSPRVEQLHGRIGLVFDTPDRAPTITAGFLYSTDEHCVSFTAPNDGTDLFLRIEGNPNSNPHPQVALNALGEKVEPIRRLGARVLLKGDSGNGNLWTLFIAQKSLAALIADKSTEHEHLDAIYDTSNRWLVVLFSDGKLERGLNTIKP